MITEWLTASSGGILDLDGDLGATGWANAGNVLLDDNNVATCALGAGASSRMIGGSNFNAGLPHDASVLGIELRVRAHRSAGTDASILSCAIGFTPPLTQMGQVQSINQLLTGAEAVYSFGGMGQLFQDLHIPASELDNFIAAFKFDSAAGGTVSVDQIQARVHYSNRHALSLLGVG
jgi:hypothetical protein